MNNISMFLDIIAIAFVILNFIMNNTSISDRNIII